MYIGDEQGNTSLNYSNIRDNGHESEKAIMAFVSNDTITLAGIDVYGNYWKNIYNGEVNVGYIKFSKDRKNKFDKILNLLGEKIINCSLLLGEIVDD